jgi:cell wall-associated NlpC family hydrolase
MNIRASLAPVMALALSGPVVLIQGCGTTGGYELGGTRGEVVHAGLGQIGTPYRPGGNRPREGLDCSGLTAYAHRAAGLKIPRMAADQRRAAKPVTARPGPGDLVFFRTPSGGEHVGLMVDWERFVHASTSGQRVQLARLDAPYWQSHYVGAGTYLR